MDSNQLTAALRQLGVTPTDTLRASLYLAQLRATQTFFATTMQQNAPLGVGNNYSFVKAAVTSASLLTELAATLDLYVGPAVDRDMQLAFQNNPFTYQQYFNQRILDPNDLTYAANVQAFMLRFPITAAALRTITTNFQQNILQACGRIILDQRAITDLFKDKYDFLTITGLKSIKSTGSDSHKGGKQVLILTFSIIYFGEKFPISTQLKLIYKPSDLEVDCLLIGNSAITRRADPNFNITASLTEIVNGLITQERQGNPNSTLELLPTYRILPRNYTSQQVMPTVYPLPIDNAYGYIEFLEYEATLGINIRNYYPFGASDFLIFPRQDEAPIITKFYRQTGQWLALACTFSLQDLHLQNVRAREYMSYLIDLEICLVKPVDNATATSLLGLYGGITDETVGAEDYVWGVQARGQDPNQVELFQQFVPKTYQNRLYALRPTKKIVPPNVYYIVRGYNRMMEILQTGVRNNSFNNWFTRLNGVLVRYTPYATSVFKSVSDIIYQMPSTNNFGAQLLLTIQTTLDNQIDVRLQDYQQTPTAQPDFLAFQNAVSGADYQNVDIPVFYHRIGTLDLVDSQGRLVPVPAQITVNGIVTNTNIGRNTFFAVPPTAANIVQAQLQVLNNQTTFNQRALTLRQTILAGLGRISPPRSPGVLIP
jgi:hypothetical protein